MSSRLSGTETPWSTVYQTNGDDQKDNNAQANLIERYGPVIHAYLLGTLKDEEAANEVFQKFSLRLMRGDFRNAYDSCGKFRSFIKTTLYRLMVDCRRNRNMRFGSGDSIGVENKLAVESGENVDEFLMLWRQSLLDQSWARLQQIEEETGNPVFTILKCRVDHPEFGTWQLQEFLMATSEIIIPTLNIFRIYLHRARRKFAECLLDEVCQSFTDVNRETVEEELIELGLHHFCVPAIANRF